MEMVHTTAALESVAVSTNLKCPTTCPSARVDTCPAFSCACALMRDDSAKAGSLSRTRDLEGIEGRSHPCISPLRGETIYMSSRRGGRKQRRGSYGIGSPGQAAKKRRVVFEDLYNFADQEACQRGTIVSVE